MSAAEHPEGAAPTARVHSSRLSAPEFVSVIIPCRNEAVFIGPCLDNFLSGEFPQDQLEILVVDGMSDDGTRASVRSHAERHPCVRLIDNPAKITPVALNIGIRAARGDVIIRADAHANYPPDYIPKLLAWMKRTGADNVGGVLQTRPGAAGPVAAAIAVAVSHPFGVGNAYFRIGTSQPRWVDTVPFGCWRKSTLLRIGLFDEELVRNQDDELNFRLLRAGGRLLLVPDVVVEYYTRGRLTKLWQMYVQYGFFKPLVAHKIGTVVTVRQLVPAAFVAALFASAVAAPFSYLGRAALVAVVTSYILASLVAAVAAAKRKASLILLLPPAFATIHIAYGTGFIRGMWHFFVRQRRGKTQASDIPLSR